MEWSFSLGPWCSPGGGFIPGERLAISGGTFRCPSWALGREGEEPAAASGERRPGCNQKSHNAQHGPDDEELSRPSVDNSKAEKP